MRSATEIKRTARRAGLLYLKAFGEFIVILWLAFIGARPRAVEADHFSRSGRSKQ